MSDIYGTAITHKSVLNPALQSLLKATGYKYSGAHSAGVLMEFTPIGVEQQMPILEMITTGGLLTVGQVLTLDNLAIPEEEGKNRFTVDIEAFASVVRAFPNEEITLTWDLGELHVICGKLDYHLTKMYDDAVLENAPRPPADAEIPDYIEEDSLPLGEELAEAVNIASRCASREKGKVDLRTVTIRADEMDMNVWGIDGFKIAGQNIPNSSTCMLHTDQVVLPVEVAKEACNAFDQEFIVFEDIGRHVLIRAASDMAWAMVLKLQTNPPDIPAMLSRFDLPKSLQIDFKALQGTIKRLKSLSKEKDTRVSAKVSAGAKTIHLSVVSKKKTGKAGEELDLEEVDDDFDFHFNFWHLEELLHQMPKDAMLTMNYNHNVPLVKWTCDENNSMYGMMLVHK